MSDRKIMIEFIALYRDRPCLWNNKDLQYSSQKARNQAYESLLEIYSKIEEDAKVYDVKRKVENMRATYRREHKKVIISRLNGNVEEHVPHLWYYKYMSFLEEVLEFHSIQRDVQADSGTTSTPSMPKKRKASQSVSTVYLPETQDEESEYDDNASENSENGILHETDKSYTTTNLSEAESFGATIGLQLKELEPMQRAIAEKLISDVIFQGRFKKLQMNSVIGTNDRIYDNCL